MSCYNNSVFNPDINQCENLNDVWICKDKQLANTLYRATNQFTCKGKQKNFCNIKLILINFIIIRST